MQERTDRYLEDIREIRLSDYFWIVFRNKWSVLLIFLLCVFGGFLVTDFTTPVYQSETVLRMVDSQPASTLLSQLPLSGLLKGTSLGAYAAQLASRDLVVGPAVRELRQEGLLEPMPVHRARSLVWLANLFNIELDPNATEQGELTITEWEDFFIKTLIDEQLKVEEALDKNVITVTVKQRTPERAQSLVNQIAAVFHRVVEAEAAEQMDWWQKPFPQTLLNQTKENLTKAEDALFAFQHEHPEITLNAEGGTQAQIILALQVQENELINLLAGAELKLTTYQAELAELSKDVISETTGQKTLHTPSCGIV